MKYKIIFICIISVLAFCSCKHLDENSSSNSFVEDKIFIELDGYEKSSDQLFGEQNNQIDRIVYAFKTGDKSYLANEIDEFIFEKSTQILQDVITDNMTDLEKEKAIHDYIIMNNSYDDDSLNELQDLSEESKSMYGFFKNGKSICLGYTQTFQLFMDMLDIPCITIHSTANGGDDHAWNMIKIDGEWYHIDVTWNDPLPDKKGRVLYDYFNVTDVFMENNHHEWNKNDYPKATSKRFLK